MRALLARVLVLLVAAIGLGQPALAQDAAPYRLNPGDQVVVSFPLNAELNASGAIGPDGRFTLPLLGRVVLGGLSLADAEARVDSALREAGIVADADSGIAVATYGAVVYVGGEVARPGAVALTSAINPMAAIIQAGGLLPTARARKVAVIRPVAGQAAQMFELSLREFVGQGTGDAAMLLAPGDIVFVPRSGIAEVNLWLDQYVNGIIPDAFNLNLNLGEGSSLNATDSGQ